MTAKWYHFAIVVLLGIAIDYFFPSLANMALGKLTPRKS
jgi:hypothetical protein